MINNKQQTEMNKEFVPYEEALALKELGFDEPCLSSFDENKNLFKVWENDMVNGRTICLAPLYQQAFRWFRYKYWYYASISPTIDIGNVDFTVEVSQFFQEDRYVGEGDDEEYFPRGLELVHTERFDTYEEAELACLKKLIEIVRENEN
jgi:hypothetical protein